VLSTVEFTRSFCTTVTSYLVLTLFNDAYQTHSLYTYDENYYELSNSKDVKAVVVYFKLSRDISVSVATWL